MTQLTPTPRIVAAAPAVAAVHLHDIHRSFGGRAVLAGLDLTVRPNEFVALVGRSGSGKSTLLRCLAGFDPDVTGEVLVAPRRSIVFQEPRLLPWSRVLPNVTVGLRGPDAAELGRQALREVGLRGHERAWPVTLSGGEAQRVALARALVREPELLLLDEPFGALDALTRSTMHTLLLELCARHRPAVLLVTHDVDEAILLADRVVVLDRGVLVADVPIDQGRPRSRTSTTFAAQRATLLRLLGVDDG
ncbi:ABC transporter ATP-binding protein [Candidatus Protofrankia californiensis]|uniref:ABC transporter ATP-binding protein n=1 Tax=Candidatus Protofrankia californiensis TaxID=1839754 RepID=UPI001041BB64|nr:ABC transporter ATP-binding protein [Candidatus Protofrankia californiensis]